MALPLSQVALAQHLVPCVFLLLSLVVAVPPFLLHVLLNPHKYIFTSAPLSSRIFTLRRKFFFYTWRVLSPILDPGDVPHKAPLLAKAHGNVLEIGPGVGDNIKYYQRGAIERLILVEPNADMHPALRKKAHAAGFDESAGSLLILGCGGAMSDSVALERAGVGPGSMDTVAAIHVLCGIPGPDSAVELYRKLLRPGGLLVFYEHVKSDDPGTAKWQDWYTDIVWRNLFDGCEMNRPTGEYIIHGPAKRTGGRTTGAHILNGEDELAAKRWSSYHIEAPEDQNKWTCIPHVRGWAIKA